MQSTLDRLNIKVSEIIHKANQLEDAKDPAAKVVQHELSLIEEKIADLLLPTTDEGMIARKGAVRAALKAGEKARARKLTQRYTSEQFVPDALVHDLKTFMRAKRAA